MQVLKFLGSILVTLGTNFAWADQVCEEVNNSQGLRIAADRLEQMRYFAPASIIVTSHGELVSQKLAVPTGTKSTQEFRIFLKNGIESRQLTEVHTTQFTLDFGEGLQIADLEEAKSVLNDKTTKITSGSFEFICQEDGK